MRVTVFINEAAAITAHSVVAGEETYQCIEVATGAINSFALFITVSQNSLKSTRKLIELLEEAETLITAELIK